MEESGKKKNKKLIIIIIAAFALALAGSIVAAVLLGGKGDGETEAPVESTSASDDDTGKKDKKPDPVSMPYHLWDMESLPEDLIASGAALANSNENIFGNVEVKRADGKGLDGSAALGFYQIGTYSAGDMFMISGKVINKDGTNWENAEMLWFWVNGTDLNSPSRLDVMINGHYLPVGETYYTIDDNGQCAVAGQLEVGWGNTQVRARLRFNPGYEG
ncbi:MAG: hypothetical protein IJU01_03925 [Lachnospiraceae bacterium]|nr:hypothetical protein [Lachnospiraceae bacterium]